MLLPSVDANPDLPHTAPIESSSNKVEMRANEFSDTDESESIINRISDSKMSNAKLTARDFPGELIDSIRQGMSEELFVRYSSAIVAESSVEQESITKMDFNSSG